MAKEGEWTALASISKKKRAGGDLAEALPPEKKSPEVPTYVEAAPSEEVGAPAAKVAGVLAQVLESVQESVGTEAAEMVVVSDSPVKLPQKVRELKEVALMSETATGEKLAPGKVFLKDEEVERFLPKFGVPEGGLKKSPLLVCGPSSLGVPVSASEKKRKPLLLTLPPLNLRSDEEKEENDKKGEKEEGTKMEEVTKGEKGESLLTASVSTPGIEGPGGKMEEAIKEKGKVLPAASSAPSGIDGAWSVLGNRLCEIRREEEKILGNTSEVLEVVKSLKGKEEGDARHLQKIRELEGALSQVTKCSLNDHKEELGKLHKLEDRLASMALVNAEWANKNKVARKEFHRNLLDVNLAHSAHAKDLQKRIRELDDEREALRGERRQLREELTKAREASSGAKEAAFEACRREELLKSEVRSLRALVENSSGWRGRRMEDLEEAVRRAVKIVSASPVGHHVKSQAAFDVLLQTLVDASILNQENIRGPAVLPFCGPKGPDRFFDIGSPCPEEIPPPKSYAGWGYQLAPSRRSPEEGQTTPPEASWLGRTTPPPV
ncbi:hypothetical protein AXF42_Ash003871 [Apostasia shenzhenica]|uniref:Uncharacterized protein n=1 Tax=Apostasia shenzhenica TaxID=1088818 RepID=A0A2I0AI47_9ASPA|nr:hypothetical protein AXF42_Ash003871 [Apostasia shenzhenica]